MSEKVVVCFSDDEGRLAGDTSCDPNVTVPYVEGMSVEDLRTAYFTQLMTSWEEDWSDEEDPIAAFVEEYCLDVSGGWVVDKKIHELITDIIVDVGSDSALYRIISTMKSQLSNAAEMTIE
jgi:hypothetical protein